MSASPIVCSVRARRAEAGLSQSQLADRVGVSRQALSGIESGRQVPSTALALQLSRVLGCAVEDLFRLSEGPVEDVRVVGHQDGPKCGRVVLGRVDGELVAHPTQDDRHAADGVLLASADSGATQLVEHLGPHSSVESNVLVAGCAPLLGVLADRLGRRFNDSRATWIAANSSSSLDLLEDGLVHIAGIHFAEVAQADVHIQEARRVLPGKRGSVVNLACWRQGLLVAPGNPLGIESGDDINRPGLRVVTRDEGAAAQKLLVSLSKGPLSGPFSRDHRDVAQLVRRGIADVGVAIESAALAEGLDFVPLSEERFDLIVPHSRLAIPAISRFIDLIDQHAFRAEAAHFPGYDLSEAGHALEIEA